MEDISPEIAAARAKLRERFGDTSSQIGGKGTARRNAKKIHKGGSEDKKLQVTLKKIGCQNLPGIEEVVFYSGEEVMIFNKPRMSVAPASNTYVVSGEHRVSSPQEVLMEQLRNAGGLQPDLIEKLKKMNLNLDQSISKDDAFKAAGDDDDDDIPELVENFEDVSKQDKKQKE